MVISKYLLFANLMCWFVPVLFAKGLVRSYLFAISLIFSGSYWVVFVFYLLYDIQVPVTVVEYYINKNLYSSAAAAVSFYLSLFLFLKRDVPLYMKSYLMQFSDGFGFDLKIYPFLLSVGVSLAMVIYIDAIPYIGVAGRVYFLDVIHPFWYTVLIPLNMILLVAIILSNEKLISINSVRKDIVFWGLMFAHVVIVGFDGGRRQVLLPLFLVILKVVLSNYKRYARFFVFNVKTVNIILLYLLVSFFSLSRSFEVGWGILRSDLNLSNIYRSILQLSLAINPTIHVNTKMFELVDFEGTHGISSYLSAFGNFLLPKFIFQKYYFGEPLSLRLGHRFGWYGFDFGFMAEAIYAGGIYGVMIAHFIYGLFVAFVLNGYKAKRNGIFFVILSMTIIFGMVNSLRSDFMNLLKATFYPAIALYYIYRFSGRIFLRKRFYE